MRLAFILSFAAKVVLALASLAILPDRVAIHFGAGGMADNWASSSFNTLFSLGIDVLLFCCFYFTPFLVSKTPDRWINLPHKDYWLAPENRGRAEAKLASSMYRLGTVLFLFLFLVNLLTIEANLSQPARLREEVFLPALLLFMAYTLWWCFALYRNFRVPQEAP